MQVINRHVFQEKSSFPLFSLFFLLKKEELDRILPFLERWLSGRRHVPAKDAYQLNGTVGSNPTLSDLVNLGDL